MPNNKKFKQYCSFADIATFFKGLFANRATTKDPVAEIDRFVTEVIKEIETLTESAAIKAVKKPDCYKYLFVHVSTDLKKISFYESSDDGNLFVSPQGDKRFYLLPNMLEEKYLKITHKVPNMALYLKPYCTKVTEELERRGYNQPEDADFLQLVINLSQKFNLTI